MSNKVRIVLLITLFTLAGLAFGQDAGGASASPDAIVIDWKDNGITALVVTIIMAVFKVMDKRNIGSTVEAVKLDQIIANTSGYDDLYKEVKDGLEELKTDLGAHSDAANRAIVDIDLIDTKLNRIVTLVELLNELHAKTDGDGIPLVFIPRSWHETQRDMQEVLRQLAISQRDLIEIVRNQKQ